MRKRSEARASEPTTFKVRHDVVHEQVVLAAALVATPQQRKPILRRVVAEHFRVDAHVAAWRVVEALDRQGLAFDPATFQHLGSDGVKIAYILDLVETRPEVPDNLDFHIDALHWGRKRATAVEGPLSSFIEAVADPAETPERVRALARHVAEAFGGEYTGRQYLYDPTQLVDETMRSIKQRVAGHQVHPFGLDGLDYFDDAKRDRRMVPGTTPGTMTFITGVPGSGKSTLAINLVNALSDPAFKRRIAVGAWEMQAPITLEMLAVMRLGWSRSELLDPVSSALRGKPVTPERLVQLEEAMHVVSKRVRFVKNPFRRGNRAQSSRQGKHRPSNEENLDLVQELVADSACDVFVADLWARCLVSRKPEDEEEALFRQQAMLEELRVHGIFLHQQRHKDIEMRADKRPSREGLKGSGAYLEAADTVIGANRPAMWKRIDDDTFEAFVLKQRYGKWPLGIAFDYDADKGSITGGRHIDYDQSSESYAGEGRFPEAIPFNRPKPGGQRRGR